MGRFTPGLAGALLCAIAVLTAPAAAADPAPAPAPAPSPAPSPAAAPGITDGTYTVGKDIAPQTVQILDTDVTFRTRGCQPWQPTDAQPPGVTPPWLSQLQLRHNLDILNGLAGQSGNGQLPPY